MTTQTLGCDSTDFLYSLSNRTNVFTPDSKLLVIELLCFPAKSYTMLSPFIMKTCIRTNKNPPLCIQRNIDTELNQSMYQMWCIVRIQNKPGNIEILAIEESNFKNGTKLDTMTYWPSGLFIFYMCNTEVLLWLQNPTKQWNSHKRRWKYNILCFTHFKINNHNWPWIDGQ